MGTNTPPEGTDWETPGAFPSSLEASLPPLARPGHAVQQQGDVSAAHLGSFQKGPESSLVANHCLRGDAVPCGPGQQCREAGIAPGSSPARSGHPKTPPLGFCWGWCGGKGCPRLPRRSSRLFREVKKKGDAPCRGRGSGARGSQQGFELALALSSLVKPRPRAGLSCGHVRRCCETAPCSLPLWHRHVGFCLNPIAAPCPSRVGPPNLCSPGLAELPASEQLSHSTCRAGAASPGAWSGWGSPLPPCRVGALLHPTAPHSQRLWGQIRAGDDPKHFPSWSVCGVGDAGAGARGCFLSFCYESEPP